MEQSRIYKIKKAFAEKRQRRENCVCKTISIKLDVKDASRLDQFFLHAKFLYNEIILSENIFEFKITNEVRVFDEIEKDWIYRETIPSVLSAQMRHGIHNRAKQNIINLAKAKAQGLKVGALKPVKFVNSIPLKQFNAVFKFNYIKRKVFVQNLGWFRAYGLDQIPEGADIGTATLVRQASGYYLKVCVFEELRDIARDGTIGLDFGIKDSVTSSTGEKFNWKFDYRKIKRLHKALSRKKKGSKNRVKARKKLKKAYEKITRKKDGCANEFAHKMKSFERVVIQDENLVGWHQGFFGKQVSRTILGRLKAKIKNLPNSVVVNRFFPSTQICLECSALNKLPLEQRFYRCDCGFYHEDRDVKAAESILRFGLAGGEPSKPVEKPKATVSQETCALVFTKQEAEVSN